MTGMQVDLFGQLDVREQRRAGFVGRGNGPLPGAARSSSRHQLGHLRLPAGEASDSWRTPRWLVRAVDSALPGGITFDAACTSMNAVSRRGYGMHHDRGYDGLAESWNDVLREQMGGWRGDLADETVWCNPPYGDQLPKWMARCAAEAANNDFSVVALVPARVETRWWADSVIGAGASVAFFTGRIAFENEEGVESDAPPHGSALIRWRGKTRIRYRHEMPDVQRFAWVDARRLRSLADRLGSVRDWPAKAEVRSMLECL